MIYIDSESAVRGEVLRLSTTINGNGAVVAEDYTQIFGSHWCAVQPLTDGERFANEQLKVRATHKIYPEVDVVASVVSGDFYRIDGANLYRIVEPFDYKTLGYFKVWEGAFGTPTAITLSTKRVYTFDNIPPGVYTFGTGLFAGVAPFAIAPDIFAQMTSDGDMFPVSVSTTGFTLVDRLEGETPLATVYIWEK